MQKLNFVLPTATLLFFATIANGTSVSAQGFDNYVAPQTAQQRTNAPQTTQQVISQQQNAVQTQRDVANRMQAQQTRNGAQQQATTQNAVENQGGYIGNDKLRNAIADPPANYKPTQAELEKLDEFLARWEEHGKNIKRVSCQVHMREFDSVLQRDSKRPVSHTYAEFRFIMPNKLSYHVAGEFEYSDETPEGEWKKGQNEWQIVLDGKNFTQYDYKNKKALVFPIAEDEQDIDLSMDNGQFPLFFVAKAETLKSRFYLRIITPQSKQRDQVWIEAFPRYTRDAQQFQSITVGLDLKDLQPSFMRKVGVNGKSKTDLTFQNVTINKGVWGIEGNVALGWEKDVREEPYSLINQQTIVTEDGTVATLITDPAKFPSNRRQNEQVQQENVQTNQRRAGAAAQTKRTTTRK